MEVDEPSVKCVAIGDAGVGKTCLLISYTEGKFPETYVPTVFDTYQKTLEINNTTIDFELWDTAGSEALDNIREMAYDDADIFLVVYAVTKPESLTNVKDKWVKDIRKHTGELTPFVLVGNKIDLRETSEASDVLSTFDGKDMAKDVEANSFCEASAKTREGLKNVFDEIITHAFAKIHKLLGIKASVTEKALKKERNGSKSGCLLL